MIRVIKVIMDFQVLKEGLVNLVYQVSKVKKVSVLKENPVIMD